MFEDRKKIQTKQVTFRVKIEEYEWLQDRANELDVMVVDFIRSILRESYIQYNNEIKTEIKTETKKCIKCDTIKPITEFNVSRTDKSTGIVYKKKICRECEKLNKK